METKRNTNTQGVEFKYISNGDYIKVLQLNDKQSFRLSYNSNLDVIETIESFLNSIDEIESYSLVVNNTSKIQGYLFAIDTKNNSFLTLKNFIK